MSTAGADYAAALRAGIYTVLNGKVIVGGKTYKVYKDPVRGGTNRAYVQIGTIIDNEDGTKESFIYRGSIAIEVVDESQVNNPTRDLSESINNKVRSLLKTSKGSTFAVTGYTLTVFKIGGSDRMVETLRDKRKGHRIIDIYEFIIQ